MRRSIPWKTFTNTVKTALIGVALIAVTGATPAVEAPADTDVLQRLAAAHHAHTTAQGTLRWFTSHRDDPDTPAKEQRVSFRLRFPASYHLVITKPADDESKTTVISDGTTRWIAEQSFADMPADVTAQPVGQNDALEQRLLACLRFDLAALQQDFAITTSTTANAHQITLTPTTAALKEQLVSARLTVTPTLGLTTVVLDDVNGNRRELRIDEVTYDQSLPADAFRAPR